MDEIQTASCWCVVRRAAIAIAIITLLAMLFGALELPIGQA